MGYDFTFIATLYFSFGVAFSSTRLLMEASELSKVKKSIFFQGNFSILFWIGIILGFILEVFFWPSIFTKMLRGKKVKEADDEQ